MASWSGHKTITVGRFSNFGFTSIGQYAYLIGGSILEGNAWVKNSNVYIYDSVTDVWSLKTIIPSSFGFIHGAIYDGNYIYCFGYSTGSMQPTVAYQFDPVYNTWITLQWTDLRPGFSQSSIVYSNGKVYFFQRNTAYSNIISYNISNNQWELLFPIPSQRNKFGIGAIANKIYIIGGDVIPNTDWMDSALIEALDTNDNSWSKLSSMLIGKHDFSCAVHEKEIYAIAGIRQNTSQQSTFPVSDVQIYNTVSDSWRYGAAAPFSGYTTYLIANTNGLLICTNGIVYYILDLKESKITNPSPTAGFINEKAANTFTWALETNPAGITQKASGFQWRVRGSANINTINTGANQFATIPANTLPNGEFEWRVTATSANDIIAPFTEWFLLTTIDPKPNKPTGLYPNTGSRDGTKTIQFSWLHNSPLSTPQFAFEVQLTYDGGYSWKALSNKVMTATTQFTAAANTIIPTDPTGRIGWRVRTYNTDDIASDWGDIAFFIVHPAPQTPNWISVETGRARPLCRWTSLGQIGFQIQVTSGETILFDSGEIHGTAVEYRIPDFLQNGIFTFRLRIKNIRGLFSGWADRSVSVNARRSLDIILQGEAVKNGAQLTFDVEVRLIE